VSDEPTRDEPSRPARVRRKRKTDEQRRVEATWKRPWREVLRDLCRLGLSDPEIGTRLEVNATTILRWRRQLDIPPLRLRRVPPPRKPPADLPVARIPELLSHRAPSRW